jgi:hypothetical protein
MVGALIYPFEIVNQSSFDATDGPELYPVPIPDPYTSEEPVQVAMIVPLMIVRFPIVDVAEYPKYISLYPVPIPDPYAFEELEQVALIVPLMIVRFESVEVEYVSYV